MHKKANLWLHLASWNLPDSQLCLESKTKPGLSKAQNYIGVGTPHRKNVCWKEGGTAYTVLMRGTIGVGTPHNIERQAWTKLPNIGYMLSNQVTTIFRWLTPDTSMLDTPKQTYHLQATFIHPKTSTRDFVGVKVKVMSKIFCGQKTFKPMWLWLNAPFWLHLKVHSRHIPNKFVI